MNTPPSPIQKQLTEEEILQNKELFNQEEEVLKMTLNEFEFKVFNSHQDDNIIATVNLSIIPQQLDSPTKFTCTQEITFINFPVIKLIIKIPNSYPSQQAPKIAVSGFYKKYESQIQQFLQDKWMPDSQILYQWYCDCQNDLLPMLFAKPDNKILTNIEYQQLKEEQFESLKFELDTKDHQCDICYSSFMGKEKFIILMGCQHYFCKDCMRYYCEQIIDNGELQKLVCPSFLSKCRTILNEANFQEMGLSEEYIQKVITFSINQAIDQMEDFGWCPIKECGSHAEIDKLKNFGKCMRCNFLFCLTCKEKYHFFKRCPQLFMKYEEYKNNKELQENQIIKIQEMLNEYYISQCTKACPNCSFIIQKIDGCNKMTCSRCGKYFCWSCMSVINGYDHFSDNPQCGDIIAAAVPEQIESDTLTKKEQEIFIMKRATLTCIICPKCRNINNKLNSINLLICDKCQNQFCYQCGRNVTDGNNHYEVTNCYYKDQVN